MKKTLFTFLISLFFGLNAFAYLPSVKYTLNLNNSGVALTNYKLLVTFAGSTYISSNNLKPNFDDVRFSTQPTCPTTFINHYVERVIGGVGTMWVDMPTFPTGTTTIYMYFGDATAPSGSNFAAVFPNAYIAPVAATTLSGVQNYDWFEVPAGATINLTQGDILTVNASRIKISGVINGVGKGYTIGANNSIGNGPGGGTFSPLPVTAGAGGGSYAGVGGTGGYDPTDIPGIGGATYGTSTGTDVNFGSAGGSSSNTLGGNGGGALILNAKVQTSVTGTITVAGANGVLPGVSFGGGGGAGGCISIKGDYVELTGGTLIASGGAGTNFPTTPTSVKDGGGGGGGGRIKVFYGLNIAAAGVTSIVSGGVGGNNGDAFIGENGGVGSSASMTVTPYANYSFTSSIGPISCFPLPVQITSFDVKKVSNTVATEWTTENEMNVKSYEIEHSNDAISFTKIGEIISINSINEYKYQFIDQHPKTGVNYYRLKQIDLNNQSKYTETKNVLFSNDNEIRVYPNPTSHQITVSIDNFKKPIVAFIMNQMGQKVMQINITKANTDINVSELAQGIYFLNVNGSNLKLIKE